MYIQNTGKHPRWGRLRKQFTAFCHSLFLQKAPSEVFSRLLNTPLNLFFAIFYLTTSLPEPHSGKNELISFTPLCNVSKTMMKASRPPFFTTFFDALQGSLKKDTVSLGQRSKLVLN